MMAKFKFRNVDGQYKPYQPWYDYLKCHEYVAKNGGTLEEALFALFEDEETV